MKIRPVTFLSWACLALVALGTVGCFVASADTPASSVTTTVVNPGGAYPEVAINSTGWFDVGGFCKVVDVGGLSWTNPQASGVPVFIPGPAAQWENFRTSAPSAYHGDLVLTTCCRPASNVGTACATGTNPQAIDRAYGRYGEVDSQTFDCVDTHGLPYQEDWNIKCEGTTGNAAVDNGPDGQGQWAMTTDTQTCTPNAWTTGCSASCPTTSGTTTIFDSCGNVQSVNSCTVSCCVPYAGSACTMYIPSGATITGSSVDCDDSRWGLSPPNLVSDYSCAAYGCNGFSGQNATVVSYSPPADNYYDNVNGFVILGSYTCQPNIAVSGTYQCDGTCSQNACNVSCTGTCGGGNGHDNCGQPCVNSTPCSGGGGPSCTPSTGACQANCTASQTNADCSISTVSCSGGACPAAPPPPPAGTPAGTMQCYRTVPDYSPGGYGYSPPPNYNGIEFLDCGIVGTSNSTWHCATGACQGYNITCTADAPVIGEQYNIYNNGAIISSKADAVSVISETCTYTGQ